MIKKIKKKKYSMSQLLNMHEGELQNLYKDEFGGRVKDIIKLNRNNYINALAILKK